MSESITIAVAGSGATTEANLADLLNDFLGFGAEDAEGFYSESDKDVTLILPAGTGWSNKELHKVVEWSAKADLPYFVVANDKDTDKPKGFVAKTLADAQEVKEVTDVGVELIEALNDLGDENADRYLVLLFGEDEDGPGENIEALLEYALDNNVVVKDLTQGLDDIKFTEEDASGHIQPGPDPEPEAEPARPARGRRGAAQEQKVEEEPLAEEPAKVSADEARAAAKKAKEEGEAKKAEVLAKTDAALKETSDLPHDRQTESSLDTGSVLVQTEALTTILEVVKYATTYFGAEDTTNAAVNLAPTVQYRPLTVALAEAQDFLRSLLGQDTPSEAVGSTESDETEVAGSQDQDETPAPKKSRGRPRADGSPAQAKDPDEPSINVFKDKETGELVKAGRGRPPKTQERVMISENQARAEGLIE